MRKKLKNPVVLYRDKTRISQMESQINSLLVIVEQLVKEYFMLPFASEDTTFREILTGSELDKKNYLEALIPDELEVKGIKLNKQRVIKAGIFELPEYHSFDAALAACKENLVEKFEMFFTVKEKKAIINPSVWQTYCDQHSIIARTPEELELFSVWDIFLKTSVKFADYMLSHCNRMVFKNTGSINMASWAVPDDKGGISINHLLFELCMKKMKK